MGSLDVVEGLVTPRNPLGPIAIDDVREPAAFNLLHDSGTGAHRAIVDRSPPFLIGRRGAGKTALLRSVLYEPKSTVVEFSAPDLLTSVHSIVEGLKERRGVALPEHIAAIWNTLLWAACAAEIAANPKKGDASSDVQAVWEQLQRICESSTPSPGTVIPPLSAAIRREIKEDTLQITADDVRSGRDERTDNLGLLLTRAKKLADGRKTPTIVLLDSIENLPGVLGVFEPTIAGLFHLVGQYSRRRRSGLEFRICLPAEIWSAVERITANALKDAEAHIYLTWTASDLLHVAGRRLLIALHVLRPDAVPPELNDIEAVIDHTDLWALTSAVVFPQEFTNLRGRRESVSSYLLRHTQLLPRQLLYLLSEIARSNRLADTETRLPLTAQSVRQSIQDSEHLILSEVFQAYREPYPDLEAVCRALVGKLPFIFSVEELRSAYRRADVRGRTRLEFAEVLDSLTKAGLIGVVNRTTDWYVEGDFDYALPADLSISDNSSLCIHPLVAKVFRSTSLGNASERVVYPRGSFGGETLE